MTKLTTSNLSQQQHLLNQLYDLKSQASATTQPAKVNPEGPSFIDHLKDGFYDVNKAQKVSDEMSVDLASGKSQNIHETMLAATKAELSFNMLVQVRNKILEAYQEVMRMQV